MAVTLTRLIYGEDKKITPDKFNVGHLTKAVSDDLEEHGQKGVQGMVVKGNDATKLLADLKKDGKLPADAYLVAGTDAKDLWFQVRSKADSKKNTEVKIVAGYVALRDKLASATNKVLVVGHGDDAGIQRSAEAKGVQMKAAPQTAEKAGEADLGDLTGNLVLIAHGTPKVLPGRVIGTKLGSKTPDQIVDILTASKEKSKRIGKGYDGKIFLAGCFTASGGPEAEAQDDAFAKKVFDKLRSKGYAKAVVVGYPGATTTANFTLKDGHDQPMQRGEERSQHAMETDKGLQADMQKLDKLTEALDKYFEKFDGKPEDFAKDPMARKLIAAVEAQDKVVKRDRDPRDIARLEGTFGLRVIKQKPWYKRLFA